MTGEQLVERLMMPEHEDEIRYLAYFKHLKHVELTKRRRGLRGIIAKFTLHMTKAQMDAILALAECESAADLAAFRQTRHFEKIRSTGFVNVNGGLEQLAQLEQLERLDYN